MADEHSGTGVAQQPTTVGNTETNTKLTRPAGGGKSKRWTQPKWLGLILELVAIAAGVVAIRQELKVGHDVDNISKNASTVYLPDWPEHDDELTALVSDFKPGDELAINTIVGYTHFTQPEQFEKYFAALKTAADLSDPKRPLKMLVPDKDTFLRTLDRQFISHKDDPTDKDKLDFNQLWDNKLKHFVPYCAKYAQYKIDQTPFCHAASTPGAVVKPEDFFEVVMYVEDSFCFELLAKGKVKIRKVRDESPNIKQRVRNLWIRRRKSVTGDDVMKEMIFSYSRFYGPAKGKGYGWRTYDGHLIEVFWREFDEEFENAGVGAELSSGDHLYPDAVNKIKAQLKQ